MKYLLPIAMLLALGGCDRYQAQKAVAAQMRDPGSVQFRNIRVSNEAVCGEVNGKNAYGAYAGFVPFYYINATGEVRIMQHQDNDLREQTANLEFQMKRIELCG